MQAQKQAFRAQILNSSSRKIFSLDLPAEELYKSGKGYTWHDGNKELEIAGKYYEVLEIKTNADRVQLQLVADDVETDLFLRYFSQQQSSKNSQWQFLLAFLGLQVISESAALKIECTIVQNHIYPRSQANIEQGSLSDLLQPPRTSFYL